MIKLNVHQKKAKMKIFYSPIFDISKKEKKILSFIPQYKEYLLAKKQLTNNYHGIMRVCSVEPKLNTQQEYHLFRKYNFLKYKFQEISEKNKEEADRFWKEAIKVRHHIACANFRLVFYILKKQLKEFELNEDYVSNAFLGILKAIENFDYRKRVKFCSYAAYVIRHYHFRFKEKNSNYNFSTLENNEIESKPIDHQNFEVKETINNLFQVLLDDGKEKLVEIIKNCFGIETKKKSLKEIADILEISKERVRQLRDQGILLIRKHCLEVH